LLILLQSKKNMEITSNISIETLVGIYPQSVHWLRERGIACIICGEPIWGTLGQLASDNGYTKDEVERLVAEMNSEL
jgi:methionine synthase II (cobalamin-independent)